MEAQPDEPESGPGKEPEPGRRRLMADLPRQVHLKRSRRYDHRPHRVHTPHSFGAHPAPKNAARPWVLERRVAENIGLPARSPSRHSGMAGTRVV